MPLVTFAVVAAWLANAACVPPAAISSAGLSTGKPVSGSAKTHLSRQNRDFLRRASQGLTARLNSDRRTDSRKPRRNNEPQRDAGHAGSTGPHRPAHRRYRRRMQLRSDPADQPAEHPGAFLIREPAPGAGPDPDPDPEPAPART